MFPADFHPREALLARDCTISLLHLQDEVAYRDDVSFLAWLRPKKDTQRLYALHHRTSIAVDAGRAQGPLLGP